MSSKSKEHQNVESQATSAQQREAVNTSAVDSPCLEEIRIRAYEIYIERGRQPGHDLNDWLQAEQELEPNVRHAQAGPIREAKTSARRPNRGEKASAQVHGTLRERSRLLGR
jgi:hypothetical protein